MHPENLDHEELLELDPDGGVIRFAGQRALLIDAVAMGLLRKYLAENFGVMAARTVLTQFGFAHGFRMAEALQGSFKWENGGAWQGAFERILALEGLFRVESGGGGPLSVAGTTLLASYEAEQHLLHFGLSDTPACWTICGLISGYLSKTAGREIYVVEDRCLARGHAACHLIGRAREEWGDACSAELRFFEAGHLKDCLEVSLQRVTQTLRAAERKLRDHKRALVRIARDVADPLGLVVKSRAMAQVVEFARRVAKVDATVLITGESGSGKERIARLIHEESTRASRPFVAINCGAITEGLLETELFGHVRGAFTGATSDRPGLFEAAHSGSLLLDEVGEISPGMQVKLLRALQEREIRRVGENTTRKVDVRILAATNRDLDRAVADGSFRQDLYYRLKVVELHVPPLRERREDILPLARVLLGETALRMQRKVSSLTPAAADQLLRYGWPGNVRELENAIERAVALAHGARVEREDLPEEVRYAIHKPMLVGSVRPLQEIEQEYILAALELNDGNQSRTAEQLRIGSATLYRKLKDYRSTAKKGSARKRGARK